MKTIVHKVKRKVADYLSRRPMLYAFIVGASVVLFWRGVWHTVDQFHSYVNHLQNSLTIDLADSPWWDGPLSLFGGAVILYFTGAFVSSFIGNELILSGLRGEKNMNKKAENEHENEAADISDIKSALVGIESKLVELEYKFHKNHQKKE